MTITLLPSAEDRIVLRIQTPATSPAELFRYWTEPALLCKWWPQEAEVELYLGGSYHFEWPMQDWHLRGLYTAVDPAKRLAFTWQWDHERGKQPDRIVVVRFEPHADGGTQQTLIHAPYTSTPGDDALRQQHLEGWLYFLRQLLAVL